MSGALAAAEVRQSTPVIGAFQWIATRPGLEAFGGVASGALIGGLVSRGLFGSLLKQDLGKPMVMVGSGLVSAVVAWEFGRLIGSGNIAKFGAAYALGRVLEDLLIKPQILASIPFSGMGQLRIPEDQQLVGLSQLRIPEEQELTGLNQLRVSEDTPVDDEAVAEEELLGQFENELDEESDLF
jgi:hypothetical protein